ncbi:MAG TPA: type IV pilin protein [Steroidobacteraceae bacterium]|nr:type IV pilin protein [Steroidobacteraceae bacterium]
MTHSHLNRVTLAPQSLRGRGFTLIELMITVVIATILMSIAIPLYQHQVREARRTDARSALSDLASREERYYAIKNVYSTTATDLGYPNWPETIGGGYYQVTAPTVVAATATTPASFSITATPIAGKGQDKDTDCASFTVTSTGQNTSLNSASADSTPICWN